jgi:hypothetical protein
MARTSVPITGTSRHQVFAVDPGDVVTGDTVNGMQMFNNGGTMLYVDNSAVTDETISVTVVETVDFQSASPLVLTIPAGAFTLLGEFPLNYYGNVLEFDVSSASLGFVAFSLI